VRCSTIRSAPTNCRWDCDAERFGGSQIDRQLEIDWLLDGTSAGFAPREILSTYAAERRIRPAELEPEDIKQPSFVNSLLTTRPTI